MQSFNCNATCWTTSTASTMYEDQSPQIDRSKCW